jgi:hypothetical protein
MLYLKGLSIKKNDPARLLALTIVFYGEGQDALELTSSGGRIVSYVAQTIMVVFGYI